jgi:hypothetical protein
VFTPPTTVGNERPADEAAARAAITKLYADVFGPSGLSDAQRLAKIDDNAGLQTILDKQRADGTAQNASLVDGSIQFISATRAQLGVTLQTRPDTPFFGEAVFVNNQWMVPRSTFCWLSQMAGTNCA